MLAFSFIRSLNNITSAEKAKYLRFQQHELFAPLLLLPLSNTSFRFVFVFGGGDSLIGKLFHGDSVQRDHLYSWIRFFLCFHHGIHFQEILLFFIFLCCYGMEWLLWRRLSLFFSVRRSWKINEVFKVFQIPLDLNLEAGTQTRKSNLLQIVFFYKLSSSPFLLFLNNLQLNFAPLFTFMPSHNVYNVYTDKKKPRHSRNNFGRLALLSSLNNKI